MTAVAIDASRAANPALGGPVPARTGGPAAADRSPTVARPGRAIRSWPPRPRLRCSPGGSASRRRPASAWSPRCRASGPRCTWTPPSPSRSASRPTPPTPCAPGWPATRCRTGLRTSRLPSDDPSRDRAGTVAGHHARVVLAGPGPGHGDRAGPHAARRRRGRGCTGQPDQTTGGPAVPVPVCGGPGRTRPQTTRS